MPRILIVDDQQINIHVLKAVLREYEPSIAMDGKTALDMARKTLPDLILLDVMMPEMDGYEVCKRLKKDPQTKDIPVIFVTALGDAENESHGLELGAVDYITKPIQRLTVQARVKTHLELLRARKELQKQNLLLQENARLREHVETMIRHDLKTPLTGIIGLPELLLDDDNISVEQKEILQSIIDSGHRVLNQINQSMDLYKIESGQYKFNPFPIDLKALIPKVFKIFRKKASANKTELILDIADDHRKFIVFAEEALCFTMFSNLLDNSIDSSPAEKPVTLSLKYNQDDLILNIHNYGAVPEEIRETMFDKYVTKGKSKGTGIGAYSAKLLAGVQNARIEADFSVPEETAISIIFPSAAMIGIKPDAA